MTDNDFIEEDWERQAQLDYAFVLEREYEMQAEYEQWLSKNRKPAKITILTPIENEVPSDTLPFWRIN